MVDISGLFYLAPLKWGVNLKELQRGEEHLWVPVSPTASRECKGASVPRGPYLFSWIVNKGRCNTFPPTLSMSCWSMIYCFFFVFSLCSQKWSSKRELRRIESSSGSGRVLTEHVQGPGLFPCTKGKGRKGKEIGFYPHRQRCLPIELNKGLFLLNRSH